ncbi:hypothetical protein PV458_19615 [Streptomyces sp. MN03-5084-2B]|nr:hypothetical protein [Streptomyces sp. MN03-5084-2B]
MPRRRPGSLRRAQRLEFAGPPPVKIPHVSRRAMRQLVFAEATAGLLPGSVAECLQDWEEGTRPPFRLILPVSPHPLVDPVGTRRELAELLDRLPRRERALIGVALSRIDRRFAAQTVPDPLNDGQWWFERRFFEQDGWGRL